MELSDRIHQITPSMTFAISSAAQQLAARGEDVCNFGVGEPDFITPLHIREAAKTALDEGHTKYTPTAGLPELRQLIAVKLQAENQLPYEAGQILVSTGGKQALYNMLMAILGPGDEALIPAPYWVTYPEIVKLTGATPVFIEATQAAGYKITPSQLTAAITSRTRVLILNSPSNPTGAVYTREEMQGLADVLVAHNVAVLSDEIYEKLTYDGMQHTSIGSLNPLIFDQTITCNGFSKAYAATGWRLGYAAAPQHIIKGATALQSHSTSGPNTFAQYGAVTALEGSQDEVLKMRDIFEQRRDFFVAGLQAIKGLDCQLPHGAFYVFPDISATGLDSTQFCRRLLDQEYVAAVPGAAFGAESNIRLSYATDTKTIEKGLVRLEHFVRSL
ncbi:MAG: pyridoxal phosphate-dependent aminotransferase [Anaerolineales bacterium]|nr:MAG: pyridoxal phosphate-dependent aminotransferase [Anaerolineales bacterium]